mmetsp:Transcript_26550/g.44102  ORF Transcript_26550/g.44102 Transcript_26550/m.44102 type:complete len:230 (+) Transcript_26550:49-738(+)
MGGTESSESGVSAESAVASQENSAIAKLRDTAEVLEKREEHLSRKVQHEIKLARELNAAGKQREALVCMKRKKMLDKQIEQLTSQRLNLDTQRIALENMNITKETMEAQKAAAVAMKKVTNQMGGVDGVDATLDQVEEQMQEAEEINQAMSREVGGAVEDDDDLLQQLAVLEAETNANNAKAINASAKTEQAVFPSVPEVALPSVPQASRITSEEQRELEALERSMTMS